MKIPKSVMVMGVKYKIILTSLPITYEGVDVSGACARNETPKKIVISTKHNKTKREQYDTFLHEIGHAIFAEGSLMQTSISSDLEEIIVDQFANVIGSIIHTRR